VTKPGGSVSVVIPCYRCAASVTAAVRSAHEQSVRPLETIAVDDASDDGTGETLTALAAEYGSHWLRIIRLRQNRGPASARNTGWDAARGEFIAFLDADDEWHPRKLEIQLQVMQSDPGIALSGHRHSFGKPVALDAHIPVIKEISARALLWRNQFVTPSVMVRREIPHRFLEGRRYMEDHLLWTQIAFSGLRILRIELPLATLFKPAYGVSGQSAALLQMEAAELANYRSLRREGRIGALTHSGLWFWSGAKFVRRLAVVAARRLIHA
jgi:glycosyltransferase involved in cell wall biosynthesis